MNQANSDRHLEMNLRGHLLPEAADEDTSELAWACGLHEIGLMVSHRDHRRHSALPNSPTVR